MVTSPERAVVVSGACACVGASVCCSDTAGSLCEGTKGVSGFLKCFTSAIVPAMRIIARIHDTIIKIVLFSFEAAAALPRASSDVVFYPLVNIDSYFYLLNLYYK